VDGRAESIAMSGVRAKGDRPEHELLRLCVRSRVVEADDSRIRRLVEQRLDWTYLLALAARHQVLPVVHECLNETFGERPSPIVKQLGRWIDEVRARNAATARELGRLHRSANAAGIAILSFKGPALARMLYGGFDSREFTDVDIMVDERGVARAEALFVSLGYRRTRDFGYQIALVNEAARVAVDLHHSVTPDNFPVAMPFSRLWSRRQVVEWGDDAVETFSAEHMLLTLCMEAVKDARIGRVSLMKLRDVAQMLRRLGPDDWQRVSSEARALGVERVACFAIRLTTDVLDLPPIDVGGLQPHGRRWSRFLRDAERRVFAPADTPRPGWWYGERFHFRLRERWRDRLAPYRLSLHRLVTPTALDHQLVSLPPSLAALYDIVRPLRMLRTRTRRVVRAWRGRQP
jgi:hypothetical protein